MFYISVHWSVQGGRGAMENVVLENDGSNSKAVKMTRPPVSPCWKTSSCVRHCRPATFYTRIRSAYGYRVLITRCECYMDVRLKFIFAEATRRCMRVNPQPARNTLARMRRGRWSQIAWIANYQSPRSSTVSRHLPRHSIYIPTQNWFFSLTSDKVKEVMWSLESVCLLARQKLWTDHGLYGSSTSCCISDQPK